MKKEMLIGLLILFFISMTYLYMPMTWRRHKDIDLGNQIVTNIERFQQQNGRLPENNEKELLQLGFRHNKLGWQPNYVKHDAKTYELRYQDGYAAPFLHWRSDQRTWEME